MQSDKKERVKEFVESTFLVEFDDQLTFQTNLFKEGVIDSYGYIQLIKYLEREFDVKFSEEDMLTNVPVNMDAILERVEKNSLANSKI